MKRTYQSRTSNARLERQPAWGRTNLKPLPICRDEGEHKYIWEPTGEVLAYSTTRITGANKTPEAIAAIEASRYKWEPRGKTVHSCLEQFLLGNKNPESGDYKEWVDPLIQNSFWETFEPWGVEYMLCDLKKSIGGQLDLVGYDHSRDELVLLDLKTQGSKNASRYNTDAQLGSYVEALTDNCQIVVDNCRTIWARPGKCIFGPDQSPDTCRQAWLNAWDQFQINAESFD